MDRLDAMTAFAAVAETGSLTEAGRRLGLPLPTISRRISELEAHLGTRLLIRSTRKTVLTDAGTAYLAAARRILEEIREAERDVTGAAGSPRGDLLVTAPVAFGRLHLLPIVTDFLAAYPEIDVRLVLSDRNARLIDDQIDAAVRIGALPDSTLVAVRLGHVRRVVCGSPAYFAAHGMPRSLEDLSRLPAVSFEALEPGLSWNFTFAGSRGPRSVPIRSRLSVSTAEAAIDAAIAGAGVTRVLSYQAEQAIASGDLIVVLAEFEPEPIPVTLLHAGQEPLPRKLRAWLDFVAPHLTARLAGLSPAPRDR